MRPEAPGWRIPSRRRRGKTQGEFGLCRPAPHRPGLTVDRYIREPLEVLGKGRFWPENLGPRYKEVALRIALRNEVNLAAVERWSDREGHLAEFRAFARELVARKRKL